MRFLRGKLDKISEQNKRHSNYRGLSELGRKQDRATKPCIGRRPVVIKLPFSGAYRPFSPTEPALPKGVEDRRCLPRKTLNVQPFPKMRNDEELNAKCRTQNVECGSEHYFCILTSTFPIF